MQISMYQSSVPVFTRMLGNLIHILEKGEAYGQERGIGDDVLLNARLFPDMFPLSRQVQIACDIPKRGAARLAGREPPETPDTETSFEALIDRVRGTIEFLNGLDPQAIEGSEEKTIVIKVGGKETTFKGLPFLLTFVLPNLYFHITTAYNILRHNGVTLGKRDFLGPAD
jgi:hypothetical protein